jgi:hypothetical protein
MKRPNLRRKSLKAYRSLQSGPMLPPWVKILPYVLGVIVFVMLSMQLFTQPKTTISDVNRQVLDAARLDMQSALNDISTTSSATTPTQAPPTNSATSDPTTPVDSQTPTTSPTDVPQTGLPEIEMVIMQTSSGAALEVPSGSLQAAREATVALFTGDFSKVSFASGVAAPSLPRTWKNPYVGDPIIDSVGDGVFVFVFKVDPDRDGPAPLREIVSSVELGDNAVWVWLGV